MKLNLLKGTKHFETLQDAHEYIKSYLKNHPNVWMRADYHPYGDTYKDMEEEYFQWYAVASQQNFMDVVRFAITNNVSEFTFEQIF